MCATVCVLCNVHLHENPHTIMYAYARQHHVQYCTCILDPLLYYNTLILHTQAESDSLECLFPSHGNVSVLDGWNNDIPDNTVDENQVCNHCMYCMREYCILLYMYMHCAYTYVRMYLLYTYTVRIHICTYTVLMHVHTHYVYMYILLYINVCTCAYYCAYTYTYCTYIHWVCTYIHCTYTLHCACSFMG